jgi:uncharacterized protein
VWVVAAAWAVAPGDVKNPRPAGHWVSDGATLLSSGEEAALNSRLDALQRDTGAEVAVVTLPSCTPAAPKDFAVDLFARWGIGDRQANNGVLVLLCLQERRVEMETGYGVEGLLPDGWLGSMQQREMVPRFKAGQYGAGLVNGVAAVDERLRQHPHEVRAGIPVHHVAGSSPVVRGGGGGGGATGGVSPLMLLSFGGLGLATVGAGASVARAVWVHQRTCPDCRVRMEQLDDQAELEHLDAGQKREQHLDSVDWHVYRCPQCSAIRTFAKRRWFSGYSTCPQCTYQTRSSVRTTLDHPTRYSSGLAEVVERCGHCSYHHRYTVVLPRLPEPSSHSSSSSSSGGFGGGGFGGGGGGGSFGGGSSGGGGAGSSW